MPRPETPEPSPSEWKALRFVWERGPSTAREVCDALADSEGWSDSTVKTLLRRLVQKGHLEASGDGGARSFKAPRTTRRSLFRSGEELLGRAREDAIAPLLAHLVKQSHLSSDELADLRRLVEDEQRRRSE